MTYPPSHLFDAFFKTLKMSSFSEIKDEHSCLLRPSFLKSLYIFLTASSKKWPIFSIIITVSVYSFGCWPSSIKLLKSSLELVILKFPAKIKFLCFQLFCLKKGWTFSTLFPPKVPYLTWPKSTSAKYGTLDFIFSILSIIEGSDLISKLILSFILLKTS